jgi:AcrR family transcriptional regulator
MAKRKYTLRQRAEKQEETRERILRATIELHEEVGPRETTIRAIAQRAGVQRLTVYRHFPDETALLGGCSSRWAADHPAPDPSDWAEQGDPRQTSVVAIGAFAAYYRRTAAMWSRVYRDLENVPALAEVMHGVAVHLELCSRSVLATWPVEGERRERLAVAITHALQFSTWQSLSAQGLDDREIADLMLVWFEALAGFPDAERPGDSTAGSHSA